MNSYLYPTIPHWFDDVLKQWKSSGKRYVCFPILWFEPQTLPDDRTKEFWLYLYYSESKTHEPELQRVVQYRTKVVQYSPTKFEGGDIFVHENSDAKIYFKCEAVEEIRREDGSYLKDSDFEHIDKSKNLLSAIRKSIAPVSRITSAVTVQRTMYWLND